MTVVKLRIQSLNDAKKGIEAVEGATKENVREIDVLGVSLLEKGTVGGQTVIMLSVPVDDKFIIVQITQNQFEMISGALIGANQRFKAEESLKN